MKTLLVATLTLSAGLTHAADQSYTPSSDLVDFCTRIGETYSSAALLRNKIGDEGLTSRYVTSVMKNDPAALGAMQIAISEVYMTGQSISPASYIPLAISRCLAQYRDRDIELAGGEKSLSKQPGIWQPWKVLIDKNTGAKIGYSGSRDGIKSMQLTCAEGDVYFTLSDNQAQTLPWFRQCAKVSFGSGHPLFGLSISNSAVQVLPLSDRGGVITFRLPVGNLIVGNPAPFSKMDSYSMACIDQTDDYTGTTQNLKATLSQLFSSCTR